MSWCWHQKKSVVFVWNKKVFMKMYGTGMILTRQFSHVSWVILSKWLGVGREKTVGNSRLYILDTNFVGRELSSVTCAYIVSQLYAHIYIYFAHVRNTFLHNFPRLNLVSRLYVLQSCWPRSSYNEKQSQLAKVK